MARSLAETYTIIFAVVNLVIVVGVCLAEIGLILYFLLIGGDVHPNDDKAVVLAGITLLLVWKLLVPSYGYLLFASYLMHGIRKKNPKQVKAYFMFGAVKCTILALTTLTYAIEGSERSLLMNILITCYFIIYPPSLYMIYRTYLEYEFKREPDHMEIELIDKCFQEP